MKKFICGFCKNKGIEIARTRNGLRKHLAENHIRKEFANKSHEPRMQGIKQDWWITEEI